MASKSGNRKKRPTAKALVQMDANVAQKSLSAKRAAARKCATSGKENGRCATATLVPTTSPPPSTSAGLVVLATDNGTSTHYHHSRPTALTRNGATTAEVPQDPGTISEVASLRGEFLFCARRKN